MMALNANGPIGSSLTSLVGELEQHGLSREALQFWLDMCRSSTTGQLVFHMFQGHVEVMEVSYKKSLSRGEVYLPRT